MVETLAALAVQSETDNPYLGRGQIDRARAELAAMAEEEVAKRWFLNMYLGKNELRLGQATRIQRLEIYWPTSDLTQSFEDLAVDRWLEIEEGGALRVRDGHPH